MCLPPANPYGTMEETGTLDEPGHSLCRCAFSRNRTWPPSKARENRAFRPAKAAALRAALKYFLMRHLCHNPAKNRDGIGTLVILAARAAQNHECPGSSGLFGAVRRVRL